MISFTPWRKPETTLQNLDSVVLGRSFTVDAGSQLLQEVWQQFSGSDGEPA
jgi:hypothetical protein